MKKTVVLSVIGALVFPLSEVCLGYGNDGHEIVGAIADQLIAGTPAEQKVKSLLNGRSLSEVSTWADKIKNITPGKSPTPSSALNQFGLSHNDTPDGKGEPRQKLYHYTNVPFQEPKYFSQSVGAGETDIVHAMRDCIAILEGKKPSGQFDGVSKEVALILLVHYVGDLHQPLHVGAGYLDANEQFVNPNEGGKAFVTRGGNRLKFDGTNLHSFWDTAAVQYAMRRNNYKGRPMEFAKYLATHGQPVPATPGNVLSWPERWATAILPESAKAHAALKILSPDGGGWKVESPDQEYRKDAAETITEELRLGGFHLAQILEKVL